MLKAFILKGAMKVKVPETEPLRVQNYLKHPSFSSKSHGFKGLCLPKYRRQILLYNSLRNLRTVTL